MPLNHHHIKYVRSLDRKKVRQTEQAFLAEGPKVISDLLGCFHCRLLLATSEWLEHHPLAQADEIIPVSQQELTRVSLLKTPQQVLGIFEQPQHTFSSSLPRTSLCLGLDGIQDPGNLGTIIRVADWFGIEHIFCSPDTVDAYNPKVIQATMGAIARIKLHYLPLDAFIAQLDNVPVYGTFLNGNNIYEEQLTPNGLIIMGNEGNGISAAISPLVSKKLLIPNFPVGRPTSESLNVAIATSVICAEFRRRRF